METFSHHPKPEQVIVERAACLAPFNELKAAIEIYKTKNKKQVFAYATPEGEKAARSHCYQLRLVRGQNTKIHKEAKAKALAECQMIDAEKNEIDAAVTEMVNYHMDPINEIKAEREAAAKLVKEREEKAKADAETARLQKIAADEALAKKTLEDARAEAETIRMANAAAAKVLDDQNAAAQKILDDAAAKLKAERERFEAEKKAEADKRKTLRLAEEKAKKDLVDAAAKVKADKEAALKKAADDALVAVATEKKRVADLYAKEQAAKDEAAKVEAAKVANEEHRAKIHNEVYKSLLDASFGDEVARQVTQALVDQEITHVNINY